MAVLAAIAIGLQGFGIISKQMALRDNAKLNALIASGNVELAKIKVRIIKKETGLAVSLKRREGRAFLSKQRALIGATGLTSESFAMVTEQTAFDNEMDALAVQFRGLQREGDVKAVGGRQRIIETFQKGVARTAGFEALLAGLGTAAKIGEATK